MKFILIISFVFFSNILTAQNTTKEIEFNLSSSHFDKLSTICDKIEFENKILKANIIDTSSKEIIAEFLRITDNSYLFRKFTKTRKAETEGKCILSIKPIDIYKIPVIDSIGRIIKSKTINVYNFDKVGLWYEKVNDSVEASGFYERNIKIGEWKYLKYISEFDAIETKRELYNLGKLIKVTNSNYLETETSENLKVLLGQWRLLTDLTKVQPDSLVIYEKDELNNSGNYQNSINFKTQNVCEVKFRGGQHNGLKKYNCKWKFSNKIILIEIPEMKINFIITYFSTNVIRGTFKSVE